MENNALIEELKTLAQNEDALAVNREVNELKVRFDDYILEEERKDQVAALEAQVQGEEFEPKDFKPLKDAFFELYNIYRERRKEQVDARNAIESENLKQKRNLINRLKDVIEKEENIGAAFTAYKEIHEAWKKVGDIARDKRDEIQHEYSRLLEDFFYNMKIYRELKEHDLKRNYQLKLDVITQLEALKNTESIREVEAALKTLQNEWEGIGPVINDEWENLKAKYWENVRTIYDRINAFYDERRSTLLENLAKKKEFLGTIQEKFNKIAEAKQRIIDQAVALKESTDWKTTADKLVQLQKQWKTVGHAGQKLEQKLWSDFRGACDAFFNARTKHFEEQDKQLETNLHAKQTIIAAIQTYVLPADKKQALADLKEFTNSFNAAGKVPMKDKDAIYNQYKTAIDAHYGQLKLEGAEKEKVMFEARMETLASSPDASRAFAKEKADIRQQIEHLKNDILQYENNLGFFAKSKGAELLRKEVEGKINASKNKIDALIRKLKMIPNE